MKDILIHTGTWCFLYIMLCFRNINVQRKIYSEFLFLILFISFIISYFQLPILIETILITITFTIVFFFEQQKQNPIQLLEFSSKILFLCSLKYSVQGLYFFTHNLSINESILASIVQILFSLILQSDHDDSSKEITIHCIFNIIISGTSFILIASQVETKTVFYFLVSIVICVIVCIISFLFFQNQKQESILKQMKEQEEILKLAHNQYEFTLAQTENISQQKHDFIHDLSMIHSMLEHNQIADALQYISSVTDKIEINTTSNYSTNIYMNALLQHKVKKYPDIQFNISMHVQKNTSKEFIDFCLLLSHFIDNAVETIHENSLRKYMEIKCTQQENKLFLEITTQKSSKKPDLTYIHSMNDLINKHHGTIQEYVDDQYHIQLFINI